MKETFIGFNQGQYGDLFMNLTACRVLKEIKPDCRLILGINERYKDCKEILKLSQDIDDFIIWENYDDFPSEADKKQIQKFVDKRVNGYLFNPMPQHPHWDWYRHWHQTEEVCVMHNLPKPTEEQMDFRMERPPLEEENTLTICTARRIENSGELNQKALTHEQIDIVKNFAFKNKLQLIQIAGPKEEGIEGVKKFKGDYSESVLKILKSRFLVSADTGMGWAASAFAHPVIGLYPWSYYWGASSCKNWTPKNKKQRTIEADNMENINLTLLEEELQNIYNN